MEQNFYKKTNKNIGKTLHKIQIKVLEKITKKLQIKVLENVFLGGVKSPWVCQIALFGGCRPSPPRLSQNFGGLLGKKQIHL